MQKHMVEKMKTLQRIHDTGIVAVVRAPDPKTAVDIGRACLAGGIDAIEVAFTVPKAHRVIAALDEEFGREELLVGAGTVMDSETARIAILEGANYIVGPSFDEHTARLCNRYQLPYMPGCFTIKEMVTAMEAGVEVLKLFPGSAFEPSIIKAIKGPLPQAALMPTGGVDLANVGDWIRSGCFAVGVGGELTAGAKSGDFQRITEAAKQFTAKIQQARKE